MNSASSELSHFAKQFLSTIEDPQERIILEKYIVLWDLGYQKERAKWEQFRTIAQMTMNEPQKILDLYRRKGILPRS